MYLKNNQEIGLLYIVFILHYLFIVFNVCIKLALKCNKNMTIVILIKTFIIRVCLFVFFRIINGS